MSTHASAASVESSRASGIESRKRDRGQGRRREPQPALGGGLGGDEATPIGVPAHEQEGRPRDHVRRRVEDHGRGQVHEAPDDGRREREERDRRQEDEVQRDKATVGPAERPEEAVVADPPDRDHHEAEGHAQEARPELRQRRPQVRRGRRLLQGLRQPQVDHEERDRDGHHGVAEEDQALDLAPAPRSELGGVPVAHRRTVGRPSRTVGASGRCGGVGGRRPGGTKAQPEEALEHELGRPDEDPHEQRDPRVDEGQRRRRQDHRGNERRPQR